MKKDLKAIVRLLGQPRKIFLTTHMNPDGDALGSLLGLFHFLKAMGHDVDMMVPNPFPGFLDWMPGAESIKIFERIQSECIRLFAESEIIFCLDYNSPPRIGKSEEYLRASSAKKILIDHHIDPEIKAFDFHYTTLDVSSTSELVYHVMAVSDPSKISRDVAACIYAGILTDTGSFSYNCNFPDTFRICAKLIEKGIDVNTINRLVYATNSEQRLRLLGFALSNKMVVLPEYKTAYIALTRMELTQFNHRTGDTEGLVNYALSIEGIRFAALFTERQDKIRISFRSAGDFSVNAFARKHFAGGGHKNAAGGDSFVSLEETLAKFKQLLVQYADEI